MKQVKYEVKDCAISSQVISVKVSRYQFVKFVMLAYEMRTTTEKKIINQKKLEGEKSLYIIAVISRLKIVHSNFMFVHTF